MTIIETTAPLKNKTSFFINRNFALLWGGQAISGLGDMIFFVTLNLWIAVSIGKDQPWAPLAISGSMIAAAIPALVFGPLAGVFVDRWDKRLTMIYMDIMRAILIFLLIPLTGLIPLPFVHEPLPVLWQLGAIYAVVFAASICSQLFEPARFTIISEIVDEPERTRASGLEQTSVSVSKVIGPFIAAPLLLIVGIHWALIANALSFVISFLSILAIRGTVGGRKEGEREGKQDQTSFLQEFKEGLSFYKENRVMMTLFISILIFTLGVGSIDALLIFFYKQNLQAPTELFGTIVTGIGLGSILGAVLTTMFIKRLDAARLFWLSLCLLGVLIIVFARQTSLVPALIVLFLAGLPITALHTALSPILMHIIPHDIMGRVMSVFGTTQTILNLVSISAAGLLGTLLMGLHVQVMGIAFGTYDTIYVIAGLLSILGGLYAMVNLRGLRLNG